MQNRNESLHTGFDAIPTYTAITWSVLGNQTATSSSVLVPANISFSHNNGNCPWHVCSVNWHASHARPWCIIFPYSGVFLWDDTPSQGTNISSCEVVMLHLSKTAWLELEQTHDISEIICNTLTTLDTSTACTEWDVTDNCILCIHHTFIIAVETPLSVSTSLLICEPGYLRISHGLPSS